MIVKTLFNSFEITSISILTSNKLVDMGSKLGFYLETIPIDIPSTSVERKLQSFRREISISIALDLAHIVSWIRITSGLYTPNSLFRTCCFMSPRLSLDSSRV